MAHNRKLVLSGVALTMARNNRSGIQVMGEIMDELEREMLTTSFLDGAPFQWIGLTLRYGLKNEVIPHYRPINKTYGDLSVAIELDTHELRHASREELKRLFMIATLKVLVHVGEKYKLPNEVFKTMLAEWQAKEISE